MTSEKKPFCNQESGRVEKESDPPGTSKFGEL